jgi:hypothetical protein
MLREIIISILLCCIVMPGCATGQNDGEGTLQITFTSVMPANGSIDVQHSSDAEEHTPITIKMTISKIPGVNEETLVRAEVMSIFDASNTSVKIMLPSDGELMSGTLEKNLDLRANIPESFEANIKFSHPGKYKIATLAHKVIDTENSWGDMDVLYVTVGSDILESGSAVQVYSPTTSQDLSSKVKISPAPLDLNNRNNLLAAEASEFHINSNRQSNMERVVVTPQNNPNKTILGSGTLTITGQFNYFTKVVGGKLDDYRDTDETQVPLKQAYLEIYANSTKSLLGWGYTNDDGTFSIVIANPYPDSYFINWWALYFYTNSSGISQRFGVFKQDGYAWNVTSQPAKPNDGTYTQNIGSWSITKGSDYEHAFMIFQDLIRVRQFIGGWDLGSSAVVWYPTSTDGSYYSEGENIHLRGEDYLSADTVIHEFGHNYMWSKKGYWTNTCPSPHYIQVAYNTQCAYPEGWANFLALAVNENPTKTWSDGSMLNLETPTWGTPNFDNGDACNGRVAGALWDMYDAVNDGNDQYQYPFASIHQAMKQNSGWTFSGFWNSWNSLGYSSNAVWSIYQNTIDYLAQDNVSVVGDWNGDLSADAGIFRTSTGYWYFDNNLDGVVDKSFRYGGSTDRIIVGNWQGANDGIAIFRPSTGYWYFDYNLDGIVDKSFRYGGNTDQIIKGDWNGDGSEGIGIFRPSTGYWYLDYNLDGIVDKSFRLN